MLSVIRPNRISCTAGRTSNERKFADRDDGNWSQRQEINSYCRGIQEVRELYSCPSVDMVQSRCTVGPIRSVKGVPRCLWNECYQDRDPDILDQ